MAFHFLPAAVLLSCLLGASLVIAQQDCDICPVGGTCVTGTQNVPKTLCSAAVNLYTCGTCKNGAGNTNGDKKDYTGTSCCTLTCNSPGNSGNAQLKCSCGPPVDNPGNLLDQATGVCGDPHLQGAYGVHYDFHGLPERDFNLISDQDLTVNAHFIGQDGSETGVDGTWISALGFLWTENNAVRSATFTVKEGAEAFTDAVPFVIEVDGQELTTDNFVSTYESQGSPLYKDQGFAVGSSNVAYSVRLQIREHLSMIITAATHENPVGNHIDVGIGKLNVTGTVHGALGQTFAASRAAALKEAAEMVGTAPDLDASDIIEGKDVDYMTSSLLSTDFLYNRFKPTSGVLQKLNVIRKLLGSSVGLTEEPAHVEITCLNKVAGSVRCYI